MTQKNNTATSPRKDGSEVRLSKSSQGCLVSLLWLLFFIGGTQLYAYIWMEISVYWMAYYMTRFWAVLFLRFWLLIFVLYRLIHFLLLYFTYGGKGENIGWHFRWRNFGPHPQVPITLSRYRLCLLLPPLLLGILPAVHGLCIGNEYFYAFGLLGILFGIGSFRFWLKLRRFDGEDLIRLGEKSYEATVIRRNYGKK